VLGTAVNCAKTAKLAEMPFGWATGVGPTAQRTTIPHGKESFAHYDEAW